MLGALYAADNHRDADTLLAYLRLDVHWPDGKGRLHGREQVCAYRLEQRSRIHTHNAVMGITGLADGRWAVGIDQVVRGLDESVLSTGCFEHRYRIKNSLVCRMNNPPL